MNTKYPASVTVFSDYFSALLDDQSSGTTLLDPKCHRVEAETDDFDHLVKEIAERTIISKHDAHNAGAASAEYLQALPPRNISGAKQRIQYMLLKLNQVRLAMPAANILSLEAIIRQRFDKSEIKAGKLLEITYQSNSYKVIDLANCVQLSSDDLGRYTFAAIIQGTNCALACNDLVGIVKIDRSDIKYSQFNQRIPWIKGRIPEYQALLLDLDEFGKAFADE